MAAAARSQVSVRTVAVVCFTALGIAALVRIALGATSALGILVGATMVAIALHHGVDFLVRHRFRRRVAVLTVLAAFFLLLGLLVLLILPPAVAQARELVSRAPQLVDELRNTEVYARLNARFPMDQGLEYVFRRGAAEPGTVVQPALHAVGVFLKVLGAVVAILATSIIVLLFGGSMVRRALEEMLPATRERHERVLRKIYDSVGGYLSGLGAVCGLNAVVTTVFLAVLRVPFFLPLGLLSGLSSMIPFVGIIVMGTLITVVALVAGGLSKAIACVVFFILYQQLENHALAPLIYRKTVDVNPFVNVAVLLVMSELAGIPGAILAVPAVAAFQIVLREVFRYRREQLDAPEHGPLGGPPLRGTPKDEEAAPLHS